MVVERSVLVFISGGTQPDIQWLLRNDFLFNYVCLECLSWVNGLVNLHWLLIRLFGARVVKRQKASEMKTKEMIIV